MRNVQPNPGSRRSLPSWAYWLLGAAMASLMYTLIALFGDLHYFNNDDANILRPLMGFGTPTLPTFHLYLNFLLVYPLVWLAKAFPGVAWFSWMQLAFLWLACTVSCKSILRCFGNAGRGLVPGLAAAAVYIVVFGMSYCCVVTYTVTAAMLGAAAVLQILSVDYQRASNGQVVRGLMLSLLLVVLAYSLRQVTVLPILAFCGLAFLFVGFYHFGLGKAKKRSWKPLLASAVAVAVVLGLLAGLREVEIRAKGMQDYLRWQRARISVMDYSGLEDLPDELLQSIGWSRQELLLVDSWYFLDSNITAEAFEKIAAYQSAHNQTGAAAKLHHGVQELSAFWANEPLGMRSLMVIAAAALLCALGLLLRRRGTLWLWLTLAMILLVSCGLLLYLGVKGRMPLRAVMAVLLPVAALMAGLLPECLPAPHTANRVAYAPLMLLACACMALAGRYAVPALQAMAPEAESDLDESTLTNAFADLDEYALENPDQLFIYDSTFVSDLRMFPDTSAGVPHNIMFWGGWGARSPEYRSRLLAFGIDPDHLDATVFFNDSVRLARGTLDPPPTELVDYLTQLCGDTFDYNFDSEWGGVHTLQFYSYE